MTDDGTTLDWIMLTGVSGFGHHGVLPAERRDGQAFVVDVALGLPLAGVDDQLARTVNYAEVASRVVDVITGPPVDLVETVAERIASACLEFPLVRRVRVTVHKPHAPIPVPFDDVSVTIERTSECTPGQAPGRGDRVRGERR